MARNPAQKTITISLSKELLSRIDDCCRTNEMDRSTYIRQVCIKELGLGAVQEPNPTQPQRTRSRRKALLQNG